MNSKKNFVNTGNSTGHAFNSNGARDHDIWGNGVLACSYGRPGSNLMFSTDQGRTWTHHSVITDSGGFNYTAIREVSPGRLLYIHDAPKLRALYVDVERVNP